MLYLPSHAIQSSHEFMLGQVILRREYVDLLQSNGHPGAVLGALAAGESQTPHTSAYLRGQL